MVSLIERPTFEILKKDDWIPPALKEKMKGWEPGSRLGQIVKDCIHYLPLEQACELIDRLRCSVIMESSLAVVVLRTPYSNFLHGRNYVEDYGVVSRRSITYGGVSFLVDTWQGLLGGTMSSAKYHGLGTGSSAESTGDTLLGVELSSEYATANTREIGSLGEGGTTMVFQTISTAVIAAGSPTIAEHGLFTVSTRASGILWDRSLTGGQALTSGDTIQVTYSVTITPGG